MTEREEGNEGARRNPLRSFVNGEEGRSDNYAAMYLNLPTIREVVVEASVMSCGSVALLTPARPSPR